MYLAIIELLEPKVISFHREQPSVNLSTLSHIMPVKVGGYYVIPVTDIVSQCILIDVGFEELFITQIPNSHEKD